METKRFLIPFGPMVLERNLYQRDYGGATLVPLDRQWGMEGEFATVEVREAVLFSCALATPEETAQLLAKSALFHPSATAIQHLLEETGVWLECEGEALNEAIRADEAIPEETQTLVAVASMDGVHVRLDEEGVKQGRPVERPGQPTSPETPTCFKRAMVGSLSLYGAPLEAQTTPERLAVRYVAEMPEEKAVTLKARFEAEIRHLEASLPPTVNKVLLPAPSRADELCRLSSARVAHRLWTCRSRLLNPGENPPRSLGHALGMARRTAHLTVADLGQIGALGRLLEALQTALASPL